VSAPGRLVVTVPVGVLPKPPGRTALTVRELEVVRGMSMGQSNLAIGKRLFISEDTVKTHARRAFKKLGARDRAHAVAIAMVIALLVAVIRR
jgi:DNA-binding NarL/FixJ family response regulator